MIYYHNIIFVNKGDLPWNMGLRRNCLLVKNVAKNRITPRHQTTKLKSFMALAPVSNLVHSIGKKNSKWSCPNWLQLGTGECEKFSYELLMNFLQISYYLFTNFLKIKFFNFLGAFYKFLLISDELLTKLLPIFYKHFRNFLWTLANFCVIIKHFLWKSF